MTELAHRLDVDLDMISAVGVAALVRAPGVSFEAAANLIEHYALTKAAEARLEATERTGNRICAAIEAPLSRKEAVVDDRAYGEWCRKPDACRGKGYCPLDPTCGD